MFDIHLRKNPVGVAVLDMPESKEMTQQIDWRAKQPLQAACVSKERSEVLRSLRHYHLRGRKAKDATPYVAGTVHAVSLARSLGPCQ